jgi:hypothetical protein
MRYHKKLMGKLRPWSFAVGLLSILFAATASAPAAINLMPSMHFRPPAVPLVTFDPYMSIWSEKNHLADHPTVYWDGRKQNLVSVVRVDGHIYRLMGGRPQLGNSLHQISVNVLPLETVYRFAGAGIRIRLSFLTPRIPAKIADITQPVTYIRWTVRSTDGRTHQVQIYYSTSSAVAVNKSNQHVVWARKQFGPLTALKCGDPSQSYFNISGDPVGLDWGYIYTAAVSGQSKAAFLPIRQALKNFRAHGTPGPSESSHGPQRVSRGRPVEAFSFNLGRVSSRPVSRDVMVAYDEVWAIDYFGEYLRPYWRKSGVTPSQMFEKAWKNRRSLRRQAAAFDNNVQQDAIKAGGRKYAVIASLAYRQALAAMGMAADRNGQPMVFTKEETSNGDIATVDVIFPASPLFLLFNPQMEAASIAPVLVSADTPKWRFAWAPHDLGTYPIARGHYRTGGENMPVEESGNIIIICCAIAEAEGNANFAAKYWNLLENWVAFLRKSGFDPGKQLSTNDFLGFMAHNANLSVKAIVAMGAYAKLCQMRGLTAEARDYRALAHRWALKWMRVDRDGSHYKMAFNQPGTWSQLYNMAWDQALGLHIFPKSVRRREMKFYMTQLHTYGLPDRSTVTQTKTDFSIWTATMATRRSEFNAIISRIYKFLDNTPTRVPLADQYGTNRAWGGMHARPVVGAVFFPMLANRALWMKWAHNAKPIGNNWASLPPSPVKAVVIPTAQNMPINWHYTINPPSGRWYAKNYNDSNWSVGPAGFGTVDPGVTPRTRWTTDNLWLRRHFVFNSSNFTHLAFLTYHDQGIQVYINGVFAGSVRGYSTSYVTLPITKKALAALHRGRNVIAVHVHQTVGGQFFDLGIVRLHKWANW